MKRYVGRLGPRFEVWMTREWWVILFTLLCLVAYENSCKELELELVQLRARLARLEERKLAALQVQKELQRHLASQGDPALQERILITKLGLCPEGQRKVLFVKGKGGQL